MKLFSLLVLLAAFTGSANAFAISDNSVIMTCMQKGKEKLAMQAEASGCQLDPGTFSLRDLDNRWYNPSKYIWYQAEVSCNGGTHRLVKLVQYYLGECF
jgi:hypothetical protein